MRHAPRALLVGWLGFAVAFLVACGGGGGLLTGQQASTLNGQLDQVSSALDARSCGTAQSAVSQLSNEVQSLPPSVSPTLANNLRQGASTVGELATRDCTGQTTSTAKTTSTATNSTNTSTTTTPSTATSTTTTPSTPSTPATTSTPSGTPSTGGGSGGAGLGGGNGNGAGSGGAAGNANSNGNGN